MMLKKGECVLYSGGAAGAEAEFGAQAERYGIEEVNFTFEGRAVARSRGVRILSREELERGDVSLSYVSRLLNRTYTDAPTIRKVLQTIWYQVNSGREVYVIGAVLPDGTVKGGTGWGAEFAKLCNKPIFVFDQGKDAWLTWNDDQWVAPPGGQAVRIGNPRFAGTGTRFLEENGRKAIRELFARSFA
jgi:ribosomal protein L20A (L18A)